MLKGKNIDKQLDLFRKLEAVLHRNESSCYDVNENKEFKDNLTTPAINSTIDIEHESE